MQQEQWEFEYERIYASKDCGEGGISPPLSEVKVAFQSGWDAALAAILERYNATTH